MRNRIIRNVRRWLLAACLAVFVSLGWRWSEVAAELRRDHVAAMLYEQATVALLASRFDDAVAGFRKVIAISPMAVEAYGSLADAEFRAGRMDAAVEAYRELLAIYPYTYVGALYREVGLIELRGNRPEDARADLRRAVELDHDDWLAWHFLGHAYRRLGDLDSARVAWRRVTVLNPQYQPAYEQLRRLGR